MKLNAFAPSLPVMPAVSSTRPANTARVGANIFKGYPSLFIPKKDGIPPEKMFYLFHTRPPEKFSTEKILQVMPSWLSVFFSKGVDAQTVNVSKGKLLPRKEWRAFINKNTGEKQIISNQSNLIYSLTASGNNDELLYSPVLGTSYKYETNKSPTLTVGQKIFTYTHRPSQIFIQRPGITIVKPSGSFLIRTNPYTETKIFSEHPVYSFDPKNPAETLFYGANTENGRAAFPTSLYNALIEFGIPNITTFNELKEYIEKLGKKN
jgi:hypothetical protein